MSVIIEIRPQCDVCAYINADIMHDNVAAVRESMRYNGWIRRGNKDVCDACASGGRSGYDRDNSRPTPTKETPC